MKPFTCTACGEEYPTLHEWHEHRAVIRSWEMHRHGEHTRRCLSPREWAFLVLAECQGIQEDGTMNRQEDVLLAITSL